MRFSIWPNLAQPWADVLEVSRHAEATGWDGVYVADHFMGDGGALGAVETPTLEATAALAALAVATERVRLGTLVLGNTYRHPAVLAKLGRHRRPRQRRPAPARHRRRLAGERARAVRHRAPAARRAHRPLRGGAARCCTACSASRPPRSPARTTSSPTPSAEPKPVQQPLPLLIGGKGDRMMGVVARYADEWNMWGLGRRHRRAVRGARPAAARPSAATRPTIARSAQALVPPHRRRRARPSAFLAGHRRPGRHRRAPPTRSRRPSRRGRRSASTRSIVPDFALGRASAATRPDGRDRRARSCPAFRLAEVRVGSRPCRRAARGPRPAHRSRGHVRGHHRHDPGDRAGGLREPDAVAAVRGRGRPDAGRRPDRSSSTATARYGFGTFVQTANGVAHALARPLRHRQGRPGRRARRRTTPSGA